MLNAKQATVKYSEGGMGKTTMPLGKMFALAFMGQVCLFHLQELHHRLLQQQ